MTESGIAEVDAAARAAAAAFAGTARGSAADRAAWLRAIADALDGRVTELAELAAEETHLAPERLAGEVARTSGQLRLFAAVVTEGSYLEATIDHADLTAAPPRPDLRRLLRPIGPVAVFAASNFPFAFSVAGGDTASALAVGCTVVVKGHPGHARLSRLTATIVSDALRQAGAPEGAFSLIEGYDSGIALVRHDAIRAVAFTGSLAGGRALHDIAAARPNPIPFFGELGSLNPVVVTARADRARGDELAAGLAGSFTLGTGQFCTKPGVVFVPEDSSLAAALQSATGVGAHEMLSSSIATGFRAGVERLLAIDGVELVAGAADAPEGSAAPLVFATDAQTVRRHPEVLAEVFGPVTVLVRYPDAAALHEVLAELEGSLTATLHAEPGEDVATLLERLETVAGRVLFSGWPTGVAVGWAQHHGGPWPATNTQFTSVGATAVRRFLRPIAYQDAPDAVLPEPLREANPLHIPRRVDGVLTLPA